jgi:glycosyltransferase involved in cell wall biosynthesis
MGINEMTLLASRRTNRVQRAERVGTLSVVLPVYNEAPTVAEVIDHVLKLDLDGRQLELIVVESNSSDGTRDIVLGYESRPEVRVILQNAPRGKGHAVRAGLAAATGDVALIQDGDLEYSVEDYSTLLGPIEAGIASFVLGSRHVRGQPMRHFEESRITSSLLNLAHWLFAGLFDLVYLVPLRDPFTMYKVFRLECLEGLELVCDRFDFDWELVAKLVRRGHVPVEIPVSYESRDFKSGKKVRLIRDPLTWLIALVRFRVVPVTPQPPLDEHGLAVRPDDALQT